MTNLGINLFRNRAKRKETVAARSNTKRDL